MSCNLSDICKYVKGKVNISELTTTQYISTENMLPDKKGVVGAAALPPIEQTQIYCKGDVLVSNIRPYFKKIWYAKNDGGCSNDVLVFRADKNVDSRYLYYVLSDDRFFEYAMATSKGTKMPRGDKSAIMKYDVPDFDIDVQKKIVELLWSLDKKIELNNEINHNLLQQMKVTYLNSLSNSPLHSVSFNDILDFFDFMRKPLSSKQRENTDKIYPYYGATSIVDYVDNYLFEGLYILVSEDGANVVDKDGYPLLQYTYGKFWVNNHAHIVKGKANVSNALAYAILGTTNLQSIVTGAAQPKINQANLRKFYIELPSDDIINKLNSTLSPMLNMIVANDMENQQLLRIRNTLLPQLISGEIDIAGIEF